MFDVCGKEVLLCCREDQWKIGARISNYSICLTRRITIFPPILSIALYDYLRLRFIFFLCAIIGMFIKFPEKEIYRHQDRETTSPRPFIFFIVFEICVSDVQAVPWAGGTPLIQK